MCTSSLTVGRKDSGLVKADNYCKICILILKKPTHPNKLNANAQKC